MSPEFPKLEHVGVGKREVFEEHLPEALLRAVALFLHWRMRDLQAQYRNTKELSKQEEYYALAPIPSERIVERVLARFRESRDPLELVAFFDVAAGERETEIRETRYKIDNASEGDTRGKKRAETDLKRFTRDHSELANYRDHLIEDVSELHVELKKEFFIEWAKRTLDVCEGMLKGLPRGAEEERMLIKTEYRTLDAVYVGRLRSKEEDNILLELISRRLGEVRQWVSDNISQSSILGRKEFDRSRFLQAEQEIIRLRNFQVNVERGEW